MVYLGALWSLCLLSVVATKRKASVPITAGIDSKLFKASDWIPDILQFAEDFNRKQRPRHTQVLDFFAGESKISRRGRHRGHVCETFDILHDERQDILSHGGFFLGLLLCCQVQAFGLAVFGTQCSLWLTWMSQSIHRRAAKGPCGDWENLSVYKANIVAENVAVLMLVLYTRQVHFLEENPGATYLFRYESQAFVHSVLGLSMVHTWMKHFGHFMPKPTKLMGSLVGLGSLANTYSKKSWAQRCKHLSKKIRCYNLSFRRPRAIKWYKKRSQPAEPVKVTPKADGSGMWISGGRDLKKSGAYTSRFADVLLSTWEANQFSLLEPVFNLSELLYACSFPMRDKGYQSKSGKDAKIQSLLDFKCLKKSPGPGAGRPRPPEEPIEVDPTSRPSTCSCWYTNGPRCNPCKRLPSTSPVVRVTSAVSGKVASTAPSTCSISGNVTSSSPSMFPKCTSPDDATRTSLRIPTQTTLASIWADDFESTYFLDN